MIEESQTELNDNNKYKAQILDSNVKQKLKQKLRQKKLKYARVENVCIGTIICDLLCNLSWDRASIVFVVDLVTLFLLRGILSISIDAILDIVIMLIGFQLAAYTILLSIGDSNGKLIINANDGKSPFEVLHANFVIGLLLNLWLLIMVISIERYCNCRVHALCVFLLIYSLLWTGNIILDLYAIRTFIKNDLTERNDNT